MSQYTLRYHSIKRSVEELKVIKNSGVNWVSIQDDTFTLNRRHAQELCEEIIRLKLGLNFWLLTRSDTLDKDFLNLLYMAGVRHINFGLESASPRVLYNIKKVRPVYSAINNYIPEKKFLSNLKQVVKMAKGIGYKVGVSIILGLPGETFKEGLRTLKLVKDLQVDTYAHNFLNIFAGTELFKSHREYGLKLPLPKHNEIFNDPTVFAPVYKYNINRIRRLDNEMQIRQKAKISFLHLPKVLMGSYSEKERNYYPSEIIYSGNKFFAQWARENSAFSTATVYGENLESLFKDKKSRVKIIVERMSFHSRYLYLTPKQLECLRPYEVKKLLTVKRLNAIDFRQAKLYNKKACKQRKKVSNLLFSKYLASDGHILDLCRWSNRCAALAAHRLIIDKNGSIFTCFAAKSIGNIKNINLEGIKARIREISVRTLKQRKCSLCKVKDSCCKCLFLDGLSDKEYCRIRRSMPDISKTVEGVFIAEKFADSQSIFK